MHRWVALDVQCPFRLFGYVPATRFPVIQPFISLEALRARRRHLQRAFEATACETSTLPPLCSFMN